MDTDEAFPFWPVGSVDGVAEGLSYHAATQLASGRLSFIVDPGAWTNLVGKSLARRLCAAALAAGHKPTQSPMSKPLEVAGVGNGSQRCNFKMSCPIAVPNADGSASLHTMTVPIVEGTGEDLPGLLGLRTLEQQSAILDVGGRQLIFPGLGGVKFDLPPGSVSVPLEKAPSGHLVMTVDAYHLLQASHGGLVDPDSSMNLHAAVAENVHSQSAESSSAVGVESRQFADGLCGPGNFGSDSDRRSLLSP